MKRVFPSRALTVAFLASLVMGSFAPASASAQTNEELQRQIDALQMQLDAKIARDEAVDAEQAKAEELSAKPAEQQQGTIKWGPAPTFTSPDGRFQMKLRGRLLVDAGRVRRDGEFDKIGATEMRAARLGIEGKAWRVVGYKFEVDFAGNDVAVKDAYLSFGGPVQVKVGQFRLATSLEEATSSRFVTFMERASYTDAFGFGRQIGIGIGKGGANWSAQAAIFRGSVASNARDEGVTLAGRVTFGPEFGGIQTHFGGAVRYRNAGQDQPDFRYRQRPHNHLALKYLDTGSLARKDLFWGIEAAAVRGPVSLQVEYGWLDVRLNNWNGKGPDFAGGYASLSWFITGESRSYKAGKGAFGRINVARPVFDGGPGAWQVAARYDRIDLSEGAIRGGEQDSYILGVNWYLNNYTRLMANYSRSEIVDSFQGILSARNGEARVSAFGVRAQVDW
jgi:phosphate-selective porin OprO/OprP